MEQPVFDAFNRLFNINNKQPPTQIDVDLVRELLYDDECMQELEKKNAALRRAISDFIEDPIVFIEAVVKNAEQKKFLRSLAELDAPPAPLATPPPPPVIGSFTPISTPERPAPVIATSTPPPTATIATPIITTPQIVGAPQAATPAAAQAKSSHWSDFAAKPKPPTTYERSILTHPDWKRFREIVEEIAHTLKHGDGDARFHAQEKWDAWYATTWRWTRGESSPARIPLGDYLRQCMNDLQNGLDPSSDTYKTYYVGT